MSASDPKRAVNILSDACGRSGSQSPKRRRNREGRLRVGAATGLAWVLVNFLLIVVEKTIYFFQQKSMEKNYQTIENKVISSIYGHGRGWVFTPKAFTHLAEPRVIGVTLGRLTKKGMIRRLARGLYDYPKRGQLLGSRPPSADDIAKALKDRDQTRIQPSGAQAANILGLSEQVPAKIVYLTDGAPRAVRVGNRQIVLKRTTPRYMTLAGSTSGMVVEALRWIGKRHADDNVIRRLRARLSDADRQKLLRDIQYAPAWIANLIRKNINSS